MNTDISRKEVLFCRINAQNLLMLYGELLAKPN